MKSNRLRKGDEVPYAQIANEISRHPALSLKAKGLYTYMYSMPDNWNFTASSIASQIKENRKTILSILNELKEFGLLEYEKLSTGKGIYTIYSTIVEPEIEENPENKPKSKKGTLGKNEPKSEKGTLPKNSQSPKMPPCKNATVAKTDCIKNKDTFKNKDFNKNPERQRGEDKKSSFKSKGKRKTQKLNLPDEVRDYKDRLYRHSYVGRITLHPINVEQRLEHVYIDNSRKIYTDSKSNKQILTSTLEEIYKQLHEQNELKKRMESNLKE